MNSNNFPAHSNSRGHFYSFPTENMTLSNGCGKSRAGPVLKRALLKRAHYAAYRELLPEIHRDPVGHGVIFANRDSPSQIASSDFFSVEEVATK